MPAPLISIITATYNCSHILHFAIASVLNSDFDDWELIVVGDHCTDDTQDCVESFGDERIRFFNLPQNSGQQATPNNFGMTKARGELICFLNHDDMFLPRHLRLMCDAAHRTPGSIVLARYVEVLVDDRENADQKFVFRNGGPSDEVPSYQPNRWQIASSWCVPAEVARSVGPWRLEGDTFVTPSQDWLFRAWRAGNRIESCMEYSMLSVISGMRRSFYKDKRDAEHRFLYERYVQSDEHVQELQQKVIAFERRRKTSFAYWRRRAYDIAIGKPSQRLGLHPNTVEMILRTGGKGGFIRNWRKKMAL